MGVGWCGRFLSPQFPEEGWCPSGLPFPRPVLPSRLWAGCLLLLLLPLVALGCLAARPPSLPLEPGCPQAV